MKKNKRDVRAGGIGFVVFAILFVVLALLESQRPDGDNPVLSVDFIREHESIFTLIAYCYFGLGISFLVGLVGSWQAFKDADSMLVRLAFAFAALVPAFYLLQGALRMASGTILYMSGMDEEYGRAAYLAIQMVGTQGLVATAGLGLDLFAGLLSVHALRSGALPRWLAYAGLYGFVQFGMAIFGKFVVDSVPGFFVLYMAGYLIMPVWVSGTGIWAMRTVK